MDLARQFRTSSPRLQHLNKLGLQNKSRSPKPNLIKSSRETVTLLAKLKGMGREAPCTVSAVKLSLPEFRITEFIRCDVLQAPSDLPDGEYFVSLGNRKMRVLKENGIWH